MSRLRGTRRLQGECAPGSYLYVPDHVSDYDPAEHVDAECQGTSVTGMAAGSSVAIGDGDGNYAGSMACQWTFSPADDDETRLGLVYTELQIEACSGCCFDGVEVTYGPGATRADCYCSRTLPAPIDAAVGNPIDVRFYSDFSVSYRGFQATVVACADGDFFSTGAGACQQCSATTASDCAQGELFFPCGPAHDAHCAAYSRDTEPCDDLRPVLDDITCEPCHLACSSCTGAGNSVADDGCECSAIAELDEDSGTCELAQCFDQAMNGLEWGVDCGPGCDAECGPIEGGGFCAVDHVCASGVCVSSDSRCADVRGSEACAVDGIGDVRLAQMGGATKLVTGVDQGGEPDLLLADGSACVLRRVSPARR